MHTSFTIARTALLLSSALGLWAGCIYSEKEATPSGDGVAKDLGGMSADGGSDMSVVGGPDMGGGGDMKVCPKPASACEAESCYSTREVEGCPTLDCVACPAGQICETADVASCRAPATPCENELISNRAQCNDEAYLQCQSIKIDPMCDPTLCKKESTRDIFCHGSLLPLPQPRSGSMSTFIAPSKGFGHQVLLWKDWAFVSDPDASDLATRRWPSGAVFIYKRDTASKRWSPFAGRGPLTLKDTAYAIDGSEVNKESFNDNEKRAKDMRMGYFGYSMALDTSKPEKPPLLYASSIINKVGSSVENIPGTAGIGVFEIVDSGPKYKEGTLVVSHKSAVSRDDFRLEDFGKTINVDDGILVASASFTHSTGGNFKFLESAILYYFSGSGVQNPESQGYLDQCFIQDFTLSKPLVHARWADRNEGRAILTLGTSSEIVSCLLDNYNQVSGNLASFKNRSLVLLQGLAVGELGTLSASEKDKLTFSENSPRRPNLSGKPLIDLPKNYIFASENAIRFRANPISPGLGYYAIRVINLSDVPSLPVLLFVKESDLAEGKGLQNASKWMPSQNISDTLLPGGQSRWNADFDFEILPQEIRIISSAPDDDDAKKRLIVGTIPLPKEN